MELSSLEYKLLENSKLSKITEIKFYSSEQIFNSIVSRIFVRSTDFQILCEKKQTEIWTFWGSQ